VEIEHVHRLKDPILLEFGDQGAETLERYVAQIEYTIYWCLRLLYPAEGLETVIPEGVEDVAVRRHGIYELHQVKTRDESQGPWTCADVLPVLCKLYSKSRAFDGECRYVFATNQMADNSTRMQKGSFGPLYRLKSLLDVKHDGLQFTEQDDSDWQWFDAAIVPKIIAVLGDEHKFAVDAEAVRRFICNTIIDTNSLLVRNPSIVDKLDDATCNAFPGEPACNTAQLYRWYDHLILLVIRRIITGTSMVSRAINRDDIVNCRHVGPLLTGAFPDLDAIPGRTLLDKKANLAGFDATEVPLFHRQKGLANALQRQLTQLGFADQMERLTAAVLDKQNALRHEVCREDGIGVSPGPHILAKLRPLLAALTQRYFPNVSEVDDQFCLGILWRETNECSAWWHSVDGQQ